MKNGEINIDDVYDAETPIKNKYGVCIIGRVLLIIQPSSSKHVSTNKKSIRDWKSWDMFELEKKRAGFRLI